MRIAQEQRPAANNMIFNILIENAQHENSLKYSLLSFVLCIWIITQLSQSSWL